MSDVPLTSSERILIARRILMAEAKSQKAMRIIEDALLAVGQKDISWGAKIYQILDALGMHLGSPDDIERSLSGSVGLPQVGGGQHGEDERLSEVRTCFERYLSEVDGRIASDDLRRAMIIVGALPSDEESHALN